MKRILFIILFYFSILLLILLTGCKEHSTEPSNSNDSLNSDTTHYPPYTRKPNIYIYPPSKCSLSVKLEFPLGGTIIKSIPQYDEGWEISVEPSGKINNKYDYLYYECVNPDAYQHTFGWVVNRDSLSTFFSNNLLDAGFNVNEKNDFINYWIPRLTEHQYFIIYPQFSDDIDKVIRLKFSITPDKILRLFYSIKGTDSPNVNLKIPIIPKFERTGFVVAEWGVFM